MGTRTYLIFAAALLPGLLAATFGGCGSVVTVGETALGGQGGDGGYVFLDAGKGGEAADAADPKDALGEFVDPGCPDQPPPLEDFMCDPYAQFNGDCAPGEACYIYVEYPTQPCGQEIYGSFCFAAGPGQQGDGCAGGLDCGAGLVCVITGSGNQCVQLCNLMGADGCPNGLVCEPIDVEGFGGCL